MNFHARMMNIEFGVFGTPSLEYRQGHKCARHAAAGIANEADARIAELEAQLAAAQAEMQAMVGRLTTLDAEWQTIETYDKTADGVFETCARRLREAISGQPQEITTMRFLCPVCRKAAASSDDANLCCAYDIPQEAISGENEQQVGLLEIADDVIAEREAADQKWADMRYGGEGER